MSGILYSIKSKHQAGIEQPFENRKISQFLPHRKLRTELASYIYYKDWK